MCNQNVLWISLILQLLLQVNSRATLYLKLLSLRVEGNDRFCDSGLTSSPCDLYLKVCLRGEPKQGCDLYIVTPRRAFTDQNAIIFGKKIRYIENPVSVKVLEFPSAPQLSIEIYDADFGIFDTDDQVAVFKLENMTIPTIPLLNLSESSNMSVFFPDGIPVTMLSHHVGISATIQLRFSLWAQCSETFYGSRCEIQCTAQHSDKLGHYGCDLMTGKRICMPGWYGENCNLLDLCATQAPCGPMGECFNSAEGFYCACKLPFRGPFCNELPNQCQSDETPTGGSKAFPFCLNDAFCVTQQTSESGVTVPGEVEPHRPVPLCICLPGFTGTRCERDIDECVQWAGMSQSHLNSSLPESSEPGLVGYSHGTVQCLTPGHVAQPCCGPKAQCMNTYGGYRCVCPSGWTGLHCEYPPTAWPPNYHPPVNWTDEAALADAAQLNLQLFNTGLKTAARSGSASTVWTNAFVALLIVFLILVLFIVIYLFVLKRRRKTADPKHGLPPVRYERTTISSGLPLIPPQPGGGAQSTLTKFKANRNVTCRPNIVYQSSGTGVSTLEDEFTDYEELPSSPACAPPLSDDLNAMYDLLDDYPSHLRLPSVQSTKDMKASSATFLDPAEKHSQSLLLPPVTDCSNMLYLEPRMLMQPDGSDELPESLRDRKSNQSF